MSEWFIGGSPKLHPHLYEDTTHKLLCAHTYSTVFPQAHKYFNAHLSSLACRLEMVASVSFKPCPDVKNKLFSKAPKAAVDMDLDSETWDNKTITSGLKNYLRSARPTSCVSMLRGIIFASVMPETSLLFVKHSALRMTHKGKMANF